MKCTAGKKRCRFRDGIKFVLDTAKTSTTIDTAELRQIAGLGINVTEVYADARCYLKGFFNAMEAFRWNQEIDGWRLQ